MKDLRDVDVQIRVAPNGTTWVNIDGKCALRVHEPKSIQIEAECDQIDWGSTDGENHGQART